MYYFDLYLGEFCEPNVPRQKQVALPLGGRGQMNCVRHLVAVTKATIRFRRGPTSGAAPLPTHPPRRYVGRHENSGHAR